MNSRGVPKSMRSIDGTQGRLRVDDGGRSGLPVLFVHGNGGNRTQWAAQLTHLRKSRGAVAFDLAGMGQSAPPASHDYSVEAAAEDVAAVADALGLARFVLVGHSFGGAVIGAYAGKHPDRLAGLVLADAPGDLSDTPPEQLEVFREGFLPDNYEKFTQDWFSSILVHATEETKTAVLRSLRATPREVVIGATFSLFAYRAKTALARYPGPRLSIASYLADSPLAIHRSLEGIPVRVIRGVSHWLMMDRPEEFNRLLEEFLMGLD